VTRGGPGYPARMIDVGEVAAGAAARVRTSAAPAAEAALAATAAWWLAATFLHAPQNFFAPFAAVVVVLGGRGGRGPRAVRVLAGGVIGVGFGELALVVGQNPLTLFLAATAAMLLAAAITADALIMIQSGIGAVIVAITVDPVAGFGRIGATLIGGVVALVVTQLVFTPSPGRLAGPPVSRVLGSAARVLDEPSSAGRVRDLVRALAGLDDVHDGLRRMGRFTLRGRMAPDRVAATADTADAAADLALDVLARTRRSQPPGPAAGSDRADRLRAIADPAWRAGRPGRRVPTASEIRSLTGDAG
jgi:hypothetical protein